MAQASNWMAIAALGLLAAQGCGSDDTSSQQGSGASSGAAGTAGTGGTSGAAGVAGSGGATGGTGGAAGEAGTGGATGGAAGATGGTGGATGGTGGGTGGATGGTGGGTGGATGGTGGGTGGATGGTGGGTGGATGGTGGGTGAACQALDVCCEELGSSMYSACKSVVQMGMEPTCESTLQTYHQSGYCTGSAACADLAACCPQLPPGPGWQDTCDTYVDLNNTPQCEYLLGVYIQDGYCH